MLPILGLFGGVHKVWVASQINPEVMCTESPIFIHSLMCMYCFNLPLFVASSWLANPPIFAV
jgi:hypothetical protein